MMTRKESQGVIFDEKDDKKFILLVKKLDLKNFLPKWRLLKGGLEDDETEEEALAREIGEEVGLKSFQIVKKVYDYEFFFQNIKHMVSSYLVKADMLEKIKVQTREIVDAVWVPVEQAIKMLFWKNEMEAVKFLK
jgi:8-oxo-dGTP pyrophosphatase MutT (NUDIX family)